MAAYNRGTEAYNFELFEPDKMPVEERVEAKRKERKELRKVKTKSKGYYTSVIRNTSVQAIDARVKYVVAFLSVAVSIILATCCVGIQGNILNTEIETYKAQISAAESESVELNSTLNSMISPEKVEKYIEKHGMVKIESHQITYVDLSHGDSVVVSGDKVLEEDSGIKGKLKSLYAYIF